MPFPKFTSGRSGRLTFDVLNELFDRVEALEKNGERSPWSISAPRDAFFAKVGVGSAVNTDQFSFTEVCRDLSVQGTALDPAAWTSVTGGRSSVGIDKTTGATTLFAYPLVGAGLVQDTIVTAVATADTTGNVVYIPVQTAVGNTFPAQIVSNAVITANLRWKYTCKRVSVDSAGTGWVIPTGGSTFTALNGPEAIGDAPPVYGVGMQPPTSPTLQMIRQPIRTGTIVIMNNDTGRYSFSIPNGYKVIC